MPYSPGQFTGDASKSDDVLSYIQDELLNIAGEFSETTALDLRTTFAPPDKPREGMIIHADGTHWDPGHGEGAYVYQAGAWVWLGLQASDIPPPSSHTMYDNVSVTTTVGFLFTAFSDGTVSSGTLTPAAANGNYQYYTNNGAHTLAAPAADSAMDILVTNGASAGAITFSGFTIASGNVGDALDTTNTHKFIISIRRINSVATYVVKALQ